MSKGADGQLNWGPIPPDTRENAPLKRSAKTPDDMKFGFALFTLFGFIGAWLVIELSPYPADQRLQQFKRLPGVENVVEWSEMQAARAAFRSSEDGTVSLSRAGKSVTWSSFDEWKSDFDAYDRDARFWYNKVQNADRFAEVQRQAKEEADEGSLSALRNLAMLGVGQTKSGASVSDMLRNNGSAAAQMTLQQFVNKNLDLSSRQGMLLHAQSMQENYRWEGMTDDMFAEATASNQRHLRTLQQQAEAGDPDAKWVWGQLHGDTPVRIRVPN